MDFAVYLNNWCRRRKKKKTISRELHDEIGQMLTGLKMELANLEEFRNSSGDDFDRHLAETKGITEANDEIGKEPCHGAAPLHAR